MSKAVVLHDYAATDEGEIDLTKATSVTLVDFSDDDW